MNAIILAGGRNTRMRGEDKAFLEIEGRPIIAVLIDRLKVLVNEIIIVTNSPKKYADFKVWLAGDEMPDKGPLMGISSGLKFSSSKYNFIVACDMPFIKPSLVRYFMDRADDYDIVIPKIGDDFHPLFGIYSKNCISVMEKMLGQGKLAMFNIFPELKTCFISGEEIAKIDKDISSLVNINTKEDLLKAMDMKKGL